MILQAFAGRGRATPERVTAGRRLKVLTLVNAGWAMGGAERLAAELAVRLDRGRYDKLFCVTRPVWGDGVEERLQSAGVRTLTLKRRSRTDVGAWGPLISVLVRERPDILHCHLYGSNVLGTILGRLSGVPVVVAHEHVWSFEGQPVRRMLDREVVGRYADAFLTVSKETRRLMIEVEGVDPGKVRVLPNGIPPLPPSTRDVRPELGLSPGDPVVGIVTIFRPQKALDVLIRAISLVARELPAVKLVLVGSGPEEAAARALVNDLKLERTVTFAGPRPNVTDFLAAFDVAVLSSDYEGTPLAVIEYMAAGKPVVATDVGGVPDLVEHEVHGLLVPPRDPRALADAILRILRDAPLGTKMGAAGRRRQQREFSIDLTLRSLELLYDELSRAAGY